MVNPETGFSEVYKTYRPKVRRYLLRFVDSMEADDLAQEVFIKVEKSLKDYRGESALSTWIFRIAANTAIDRLRSSSYRRFAESESLSLNRDYDLPSCPAKDATPDREVFRRERLRCFLYFLRRLPRAYRKVFVLSEIDGLPDARIAEELEVSLSTVKIRLHRGRSMLYAHIRGHCKPEDWR